MINFNRRCSFQQGSCEGCVDPLPDGNRGTYQCVDVGANWRRSSKANIIKRIMVWWYGASLYLISVILVSTALLDAGQPEIAAVVALGMTASAALVARHFLRQIRSTRNLP